MAKGKTATTAAKRTKKHAATLESKSQLKTKIVRQAKTNGDVQAHVCANIKEEPVKVEGVFGSGIPEYRISYAADQTLEFYPPPDSWELAIALSYHYPMEHGLQAKMKAAILSLITGGGEKTSQAQTMKTESAQTGAASAPKSKKEVHTPAPAHLSQFESLQKGLKHVMFVDVPSFIARDSTPVENELDNWETTYLDGTALSPTTNPELDKENSCPGIYLLGPGNDDWLRGYVGCGCCQESILEAETGCNCEVLVSPFYVEDYEHDVDYSNAADAGFSAITRDISDIGDISDISPSTSIAHLSAQPIQIPFGITDAPEYFVESPYNFGPQGGAYSGPAHDCKPLSGPLFSPAPTNVYCEMCGVFTGGNFDTIYPQPKVETESSFIPMVPNQTYVPTPKVDNDAHEIADFEPEVLENETNDHDYLEHEIIHSASPESSHLEHNNREISSIEQPDYEYVYSEEEPCKAFADYDPATRELADLIFNAYQLAKPSQEIPEDAPAGHIEHGDNDFTNLEHDVQKHHETSHHALHLCCYPEGFQDQSFPLDTTGIYSNSRNSYSSITTISTSDSFHPSPHITTYAQVGSDNNVNIVTPVSAFSLDSSSSGVDCGKVEQCTCSIVSPLDLVMARESDVESAKEKKIVSTGNDVETIKVGEVEEVPESTGLVVEEEEDLNKEDGHNDGEVNSLASAFARGVAVSIAEDGKDRKENWLD
ncbi:hypothetical protein B7494_g7144 [Chlorociboria aeruginascens]|nr:hypothetical protein B7494_g7144 [Chlorociboria aeruginascens]